MLRFAWFRRWRRSRGWRTFLHVSGRAHAAYRGPGDPFLGNDWIEET